MVACQYKKDGNYYRGIVQDESSSVQGYYNVFFVDFGNIESVSVKDMKALPSQLKTVSFFYSVICNFYLYLIITQ